MYLFVDTETTCLPDDYNSLSSYRDVRLVQIAWIIYDSSGRKLSKRDFIVKPDGFEIPESSTKIHNISNSFAVSCGKSLTKVLSEFNNALRSCTHLVAHNLTFDYNVLISEFNRVHVSTTIQNLIKICTKESTTDYCGIITSRGYKWPSLSELYKKIFNEEIVEAHNAVVDIESTAKCFWYLKNHKLIHFDKTRKETKAKIEITKFPYKITPKIVGILEENKASETKLSSIIPKRKNMNMKEHAISLKSYCESIKDGDSVSKKQLDKLYQMLDHLIILIDNTENSSDDDWPDITSSKSASRSSTQSRIDDLPF
jgi:DNA polymerase-3 subunit epsilon